MITIARQRWDKNGIKDGILSSSGQVQKDCLDIISVDHTMFRGDVAALRDTTPRILRRVVALPKLPISEEGLFLFLIKWKEFHRLDKDNPELAQILRLVRFPHAQECSDFFRNFRNRFIWILSYISCKRCTFIITQT